MAKTPAASTTTAEPTPGKGKKILIIVLIILVLGLIGLVGFMGFLLLKKPAPATAEAGDGMKVESAAAVQPASPTPVTIDLSKPPSFFALDPFVVNLANGEGERYLQTVIALRVADMKTSDGLKGYTPEIRHRINLILSSKLPSEITTLEGREALARQINDDINEILGFPPNRGGPRPILNTPVGPIQAVLFNSFIIQ